MKRDPQATGATWRRWLACALLPASSCALAQVAVLDCGSDGAKPMVVRYFDDAGPEHVRGQSVVFRSLVRPQSCAGAEPCEATAKLRKELSCRKPQGVFVFRFKPVPFNPTLQGMCAGNVTGELAVLHNSRQVLPPTMFEDTTACFDTRAESRRIRSITLDPAGGKPAIAWAPVR